MIHALKLAILLIVVTIAAPGNVGDVLRFVAILLAYYDGRWDERNERKDTNVDQEAQP